MWRSAQADALLLRWVGGRLRGSSLGSCAACSEWWTESTSRKSAKDMTRAAVHFCSYLIMEAGWWHGRERAQRVLAVCAVRVCGSSLVTCLLRALGNPESCCLGTYCVAHFRDQVAIAGTRSRART